MKNTLIVALILVMGASFSSANAAVKKDKKPAQEQAMTVPTASLDTELDSLSYVVGMVQTQDLMRYLVDRLNVDTTYMDDFVKGLLDAVYITGDKSQKNAYYAGLQVGQQVTSMMIAGFNKNVLGDDPEQSLSVDNFMAGFLNAFLQKDCKMSMSEANMIANEKVEKFRALALEKKHGANKAAGEAFLKENAQKEGVVTLPSGLQYKVITKGEGKVPTMNDEVTVKYEGRLIDGTVFDSSYKRDPQTTKFRPNQVIKGWTEALTMMPVGSKWELYIPYHLAYGESEAGKIPPFSTLIFTVELVEF